MSYRIEYKYDKKYKPKRNTKHWLILCGVTVLLIAGIYALQFVNWEALLPGDPKITGDALDRLVSSIGGGEPIAEAFSAFCQEIVAHANLPQ